MKTGIQVVKIGTIIPSTTNPRQSFNKEKLEELAAGIKEKGIIFRPVCRIIHDDGEHIELVEGERRLRAARIAGLEEIEVEVRIMTDDEAQEAQITSFVNSEDITSLEEAAAFELYAKNHPRATNKEIALKFGKTPHFVAERRSLSSLLPEWKAMLEKEKLSIGSAVEIAKLFPDQQKEFLAYSRAHHNLNSESYMIRKLQEEFILSLDLAPFKMDDATLLPAAGACTVCPTRTGANIDLFGKTGKSDRCLNQACYRLKLSAFYEIKKAEFANDGKELILITSDWNSHNGILGTEEYSSVTSKDTKKYGIVVEGGKIGKVIPILLRSDRNKSSNSPKGEPSYEDRMVRYERRMELHSGRIEEVVRKRLLKEILPKITKVTKEDLLLLANWVKNETAGDEDLIAEALQVKVDIFDGGSGEEKFIKSLHEHQLIRLLLGIAITTDEMVNDPAYVPDDEKLSDLSKRYKIDRAGITKQVTAEMKPKEPKKPAKEEKPKAAKKPAKPQPKKKMKK